MTLLSAASPLASYQAGRADEALVLAEQVLAQDPWAAEAHLCRALIAIRRDAIPELAEAARACLAARSGLWFLERVRADFQRMGVPGLRRDMALHLGSILRSGLGPLGPVLKAEQRRGDPAQVNVVGTSYVRSFGGNAAFFPLFIGMGPSTLLLTEETSAAVRRKFQENLKRVDPRRDTVLVLNGDVYYHATNLLGLRDPADTAPTAADLALMETVAARHRPILEDACKLIEGRVMLLGSTPTYSPLMDALSAHLNPRLREVCEAAGVTFLDWWDHLADPQTQHLRAEYSANAYPQDVHFSLATTELFMRLLKAEGVLPEAAAAAADFEWTHVFECQIDPGERTRIWCEPGVSPNNAIHSHKIAASHLGQRVSDLVSCLAALSPGQTFAMVNVRDAFLPVTIPAALHSGVLALTDTAANLRVGQSVLDFYGRTDVRLQVLDEDSLAAVDGQRFTNVVVEIHPDTAEADEARANAFLRRIGGCDCVVVASPFEARLSNLDLQGKTPNVSKNANRHLPEVWRDYAIVVAR